MAQPNFNIITSALTDLQTEIPLIANTGPVQAGQQFAAITQQLAAINTSLNQLQYLARNTEIRRGNNPSVIQPLLNVNTGAIIPNCPRTRLEILGLSRRRADRLILALQIQLNQGADLARKRDAIQIAFLP